MRGYIHTHKGLFPEINFSKKKKEFIKLHPIQETTECLNKPKN